jgi:glycosyltransferase involved in cell wall biosynthesis
MQPPLISVVTPSYNQGEFIEDTVLSVKKQDYPSIEHIIIDGGSTDNTLNILKKYENSYDMRWLSAPDNGQSDAINKGFKMARGQIIGWLNSDDVYFSVNVFSKVAEEFEKDSSIDIIYADRIVIDEQNKLVKLQYSRDFDYGKLLKSYWSVCQETVFFRRHVIEKYQLNTDLQIVMDAEFWLRLGPHFKFKYVDKVFGGFRNHTNNKSVADKYAKQWNKEKQYIMDTYGARRYMIGKNLVWKRLANQFKGILCGGYREYYRLPFDTISLLFSSKENLTIPLNAHKAKFFNYIAASITPWLK